MTRVPIFAAIAITLACVGSEAPRVELQVVVDGSGIEPVTNDLGWAVTLTEARVAVRDLHFTTAGEIDEGRDSRVGARLLAWIVPLAHAHPGHFQGGEVIGELPGEFVLDFISGSGESLGLATLIVGDYTAANFDLRRADELAADDPLHGHTAWLAGVASKDGQTIEFRVAIDSPVDRELVGAPFEQEVTEDSAFDLGVRLVTFDVYEMDTLFDGLDFAALDLADGTAEGPIMLVDPEIDPSQPTELQDAYNQLRRTFQTHDHFDVIAIEP